MSRDVAATSSNKKDITGILPGIYDFTPMPRAISLSAIVKFDNEF